jgi:acyl-CoA synthetase (AMP-forming)/AMP-acid ligase II
MIATRPQSNNEQSRLTIVDTLYQHSVQSAEKVACAAISADGKLENHLTYRELMSRSESVAVELLRFCEPGDRVILLFHGGVEFIVSFLGCLVAGVIAVPGYPVRVPKLSALPSRNFERLLPILANAEPRVALSTRRVVSRRNELADVDPIFTKMKWIAVDEIPDQRLECRGQRLGSDIAYLQYTSGSTSLPRGVMVSHNNLLSIFQDMDTAWGHDDSSVMISWVPVFHDLGLIHGILYPLYFGFPAYILMPAAVLQQPRRWLEAITNLRGTHSSAPNFFFDICSKTIPDTAGQKLDLSSLRACATGAETVRHRTLHRFHETFAPCGLRPDAIQPGYGLAEFTLTVSSMETGRTPKAVYLDSAGYEKGKVVLVEQERPFARSFVSCGWTHVGSDIRIVDPQSRRECKSDEIGEIWVSGSNATQGYWANPDATRTTMGAYLRSGSGPFLRTGDLGFVIDRDLYIAGRLKDLIVIRGRNLYPHDIEATVEETLPEVRGGRCCAFSIDQEEGEGLVIVAEVDRVERRKFDAAGGFARLRNAISSEYSAELYDAVFVQTGTFPLTSSGKVQRRRACQEYLQGKLKVVARMRELCIPRSVKSSCERGVGEVRAWLIGYLSQKLHQPAGQLQTKQPFEALGLDSASLVEMAAQLEGFVGQPLDPTIVFDYPNIEQLSAHLMGLTTRAASMPDPGLAVSNRS